MQFRQVTDAVVHPFCLHRVGLEKRIRRQAERKFAQLFGDGSGTVIDLLLFAEGDHRFSGGHIIDNRRDLGKVLAEQSRHIFHCFRPVRCRDQVHHHVAGPLPFTDDQVAEIPIIGLGGIDGKLPDPANLPNSVHDRRA